VPDEPALNDPLNDVSFGGVCNQKNDRDFKISSPITAIVRQRPSLP